jgi:hypothetical protein
MGFLIKSIGKSSSALVLVLLTWSTFLTVVYLTTRAIAERAMPYTKIPLVVFPFQLIGDMFAEMVLVDFRLDDWGFWVVLVFDIFLLVMRDADLWVEFAIWVREKSGPLGTLLLTVGQLLSGDADDLGEYVYQAVSVSDRINQQKTNAKDRASVKRELTESEYMYPTLLVGSFSRFCILCLVPDTKIVWLASCFQQLH